MIILQNEDYDKLKQLYVSLGVILMHAEYSNEEQALISRQQKLLAPIISATKQNLNTAKIARIEEEQNDMRKMKYGDGSIIQRQRKRKDGTTRRYYQGRIYINGKQHSVYGNTIAECNDKLDELRKERAKAALLKLSDKSDTPTPARKTYGQWLDEWLKEFKEDKTRPKYYKDLCRYVDTLKSVFGNLNLKLIESMTIQGLWHY